MKLTNAFKSLNVTVIISCAALSVSLCSLYLSYYSYVSDRQFKELSIRPYIEFSMADDGLYIANRGPGLARIISVYAYLSDPAFEGTNISSVLGEDGWETQAIILFNKYIENQSIDTKQLLSKIKLKPGNLIGAISPGQERYYLEYDYNDLKNAPQYEHRLEEAKSKINQFGKSLRATICFVDSSGALYKGPATPVDDVKDCAFPR